MNRVLPVAAVAVFLVLIDVSLASAQVLGTFRWRLAPYCNVVSVLVEQKGSVYELTGTDNQCGGTVLAAARGSAHLNPSGFAIVSLTIVRPDGIPVVTTAAVNVATLNGTWVDEFDNAGAFEYNPPAAPAGGPRPIRLIGHYAITFTAAAASDRGTDTISFGLRLSGNPAAVQTNFIQQGGAPTANCPGTPASPSAAPGNLCVYETTRLNILDQCIARTVGSYSCDVANNTGASIFVHAAAAGAAFSVGRWVVVMP